MNPKLVLSPCVYKTYLVLISTSYAPPVYALLKGYNPNPRHTPTTDGHRIHRTQHYASWERGSSTLSVLVSLGREKQVAVADAA